MHIIPLTILLAVTAIYVLRYFRPVGNALDGETILVRPVPLIARIRMHIVPAVVGTIIGVALASTGFAPWWIIAVPLVAFGVLLALPIAYTLTTEGIRLGHGTFRRWTEFAGAARYRGGAKLQGANGRRGMRIWLGGWRGDDEFLLILRRAIRNAYKGEDRAQVVAFPPEMRPADDQPSWRIPA